MKLKKTKLAAIVMSAIMAVSTVSPAVYAEEPVIDEEVTEVVADTMEADAAGAAEEAPELEVVVEEVEDTVTAYSQEDGAYELAGKDTIVFSYPTDGSMNVQYQVMWVENETVKYDYRYTTAEVLQKTEPTCTEDGKLILIVNILGEEYQSAEYTTAALDHDWKEVNRKTITAPTHLQGGLAHVWYECSRCGEEMDQDLDLPAQEHVWEDHVTYEAETNILTDEQGNVIPGEDGLPQLDDPTKDGTYYEVVYCEEDACKEEDITKDGSYKEHEILATKGVYAEITGQSGIRGGLIGMRFDEPSKDLPLDNDSIELENCEKDGYYIVRYYQAEGKEISEEKITVRAHHMLTPVTVEFKSQDDMDQCVVKYSTDGSSYTITNKSCYLPVAYYETVHCKAEGCPLKACDAQYAAENPVVGHESLTVFSKTDATAEPMGKHVIDTDSKQEIDEAVDEGITYEELVEMADGMKYVNVRDDDTSTCTEDGTVTVEYPCMVCGHIHEESVRVIMKGHITEPPTRENYTAPSCTELGHYDAVTYCGRCGEILREVRHMTIPMTKHSNQLYRAANGTGSNDVDDTLCADTIRFEFEGFRVVDPDDGSFTRDRRNEEFTNYIGYDEEPHEFGVSANVYSVCEECGEWTVYLNKNVTIKIADIERQSSAGAAGHITLVASYTNDDGKTFTSEETTYPYYTTMSDYEGRVEQEPLNGLHKDDDGVYRYYVNDEVAKDYTGIVKYHGGEFFVTNGVLDSGANGLNLYNDTWYFLSGGQVQRGYNGLALYDGSWFYITNGELNTSVSGLVAYNGGTFLFAEGRLLNKVNGLWQDFDGTWYFLALGQVQTQYTGVALYDGAFFVVKNGIFASDYNGTIEYNGATFNVVNGQLYGQTA